MAKAAAKPFKPTAKQRKQIDAAIAAAAAKKGGIAKVTAADVRNELKLAGVPWLDLISLLLPLILDLIKKWQDKKANA